MIELKEAFVLQKEKIYLLFGEKREKGILGSQNHSNSTSVFCKEEGQ